MSLESCGTECKSGIFKERGSDDYENELFENRRSLSRDMRFLVGMPELCDVMFVVGEEKVIFYGVKAILAIRSRVFYKMLLDPKNSTSTKTQRFLGASAPGTVSKKIQKIFADSAPSIKNSSLIRSVSNCQHVEFGKTVIYIDEFDPDVFNQLLEYIHTGSVTFQPKTLLGLLNAADHFGLEELRKACMEYSHCCIKLDTICSLLVTAERYIQYKSTKIFVQRVLEYAVEHGDDVLNRSEFVHLPRHVVELMLSRENLCASELSKYRAAERWCRHHILYHGEESLWELMQPFVRHISFQEIPTSILMQEIHPLNIVSDSVLMKALAFQADPQSLDTTKTSNKAASILEVYTNLTPKSRGRARLFQLCSAASPLVPLEKDGSTERHASKCSTASSGYSTSQSQAHQHVRCPPDRTSHFPSIKTVVHIEPADGSEITESTRNSKSFSDLSSIRVQCKF